MKPYLSKYIGFIVLSLLVLGMGNFHNFKNGVDSTYDNQVIIENDFTDNIIEDNTPVQLINDQEDRFLNEIVPDNQLSLDSSDFLNITQNTHPKINYVYHGDHLQVDNLIEADFNNDGYVDVIDVFNRIRVTDGKDGSLMHYFDTGDLFELVRVGYITGDSQLDLVTVSKSNYIAVFDGSTFEMIYGYQSPSNVFNIEIDDLNGDIFDDIIYLINEGVHVLNGQNFSELYYLDEPIYSINTYDITGDGINDLIANNFLGEYQVYDGTNGQNLYNQTSLLGVVNIDTSFDINNDGINDLILNNGMSYEIRNATNGALLNNSNINLYVSVNLFPIWGQPLYFNGDDYLDYVVINQNSNILVIDGFSDTIIFNYTTSSPIYYVDEYVPRVHSPAFKVLPHNDNSSDFVFADGPLLLVMNYTAQVIGYYDQIDLEITSLIVTDIDNNGKLDIVAGSLDTQIYFFRNDEFAPVINRVKFPTFVTSKDLLTIEVQYSEPNIKGITLKYYAGTEIKSISPIQLLDDTATFNVGFITEKAFNFWIEASDWAGNTVSAGNSITPLSWSVIQEEPLVHNMGSLSTVYSVHTIDMTGDGKKEIVYSNFTGSTVLDTDGNEINFYPGIRSWRNGNFTGDGITDFFGFETSFTDLTHYELNLTIIDGSTGSVVRRMNVTSLFFFPFNAFPIVTMDINSDGTDDIVFRGESTLDVVDGSTMQFLFENVSIPAGTIGGENSVWLLEYPGENDSMLVTANDQSVTVINALTGQIEHQLQFSSVGCVVLKDLDFDGLQDLLVCDQSSLVGISGISFEEILSIPTSQITSIELSDVNRDSILDIVAVTYNSAFLAFDGKTFELIYKTQSYDLNAIVEPQMALTDVTGDGIDDIYALTNWKTGLMFLLDGRTGQLLDSWELKSGLVMIVYNSKGNFVDLTTIDTNNDGIEELLIGNTEGKVYTIQSIKTVKMLHMGLQLPNNVEQGVTLLANITLKDYTGSPVDGAIVNAIISNNKGGSSFSVSALQTNTPGKYSFEVGTEAVTTGNWEIIITVFHPDYEQIEVSDYRTVHGGTLGSINPMDGFTISGSSVEFIQLASKNAVYNTALRQIDNVEEGNIIEGTITILDQFSHLLSDEDVHVELEFNDKTYALNFTQLGILDFAVPTNGMHYGEYNLTLHISGDYLANKETNLLVNIIPQFPDSSFLTSMEFLIPFALIIFGVFSLIFYFFRRIMASINDDLNGIHKILNAGIIIVGLLFITGNALAFFLPHNLPLNSFLIQIACVFFLILEIFFIHFKMSVYQYNRVSLKVRQILPTLFLTILTGVLLYVVLIQSEDIEWIGYQMSLETVSILNFSIPSLVWEIAGSGFISGFLFVIILDVYDSFRDVKNLKETQMRIEKGERTLNDFDEQKISELTDSFIGMSKNFGIWYAIIIVVLFNSLALSPLISLPITAGIAILVAAILFSGRLLIEWVTESIGGVDFGRSEASLEASNQENIGQMLVSEEIGESKFDDGDFKEDISDTTQSDGVNTENEDIGDSSP